MLAYLAELQDAEARRRKIAEAFPKGIRSAAFKDLLKVPLYDYQREGCLFAAQAGRCLIGDEMGLGKTVQAIAAAEIMAKLFGVERVLIVCPTSLKHQWQREIEKFAGRTAQVIGGFKPARVDGFANPEPFFKITNYDTVHADLENISNWSPDLVVLDEAQRIKNWSTRVARSVKKIQSPYAIVLTGTPLENRLEELISIVQFVDLYPPRADVSPAARSPGTQRGRQGHRLQGPEQDRRDAVARAAAPAKGSGARSVAGTN